MNTIHEIMASEPHNSYYLIKYIKFITACQIKNESICSNVYTEKHHICPKSIFPEFTSFTEYSWNCSVLTYKQHQVAHVILAKVYPDSVAMQWAAAAMKGNKQALGDLSKGTVPVKDEQGNTMRISLQDPRYVSAELVVISKGKVSVKDTQGNTMQVNLQDPRYLSGELVHIMKDKVSVKDAQGNTLSVSTRDPRYLSGELVGIGKGTIRITNGLINKIIQPTENIPKGWKRGLTRFKETNRTTGRICITNGTNNKYIYTGDSIQEGYKKGKARVPSNPNRLFSDELVSEIRNHYKNNTFIFSEDFLKTQVRSKDIAQIGIVPITELKARNNTFLSYKQLLSKYYATTLNVNISSVRDMLSYISYKDLP